MGIETITPFNERFADLMSGLMYDLLKAAGVTYHPIKSQERIRDVGRRMALSVEYHAERKAIEVAKKLQKATSAAFKAMEEEMAKMQARIEELEGK